MGRSSWSAPWCGRPSSLEMPHRQHRLWWRSHFANYLLENKSKEVYRAALAGKGNKSTQGGRARASPIANKWVCRQFSLIIIITVLLLLQLLQIRSLYPYWDLPCWVFHLHIKIWLIERCDVPEINYININIFGMQFVQRSCCFSLCLALVCFVFLSSLCYPAFLSNFLSIYLFESGLLL